MVYMAEAETGSRLPPPGPRRPPARLRTVGVLLGAALVIAATAVYLQVDREAKPDTAAVSPDWSRPAVSASELPGHLGVRLTHVAVTGGGGLVDLRFQVVDPELANAIHEPATPPAIVAERTGLFLNQLLMGHAHSGPYQQAETYYLLFINNGNWVHRGDEVTVLLGGVQVEHVTVR